MNFNSFQKKYSKMKKADLLKELYKHQIVNDDCLDYQLTYNYIFENAVDPMFVIENHIIIDCNQALIDLLGYNKKNELLKEMNRPGASKYETTIFSQKMNDIYEIANKKGSVRFEWLQKTKNNEYFPCDIIITLIPLKNKQILFGVLRDITYIKEIERVLIESENIYRTIFENTGQATVIIEDSGLISLVNSSFETFSGYKKKELELKKVFFDFIPDDIKSLMINYHELRRKGDKDVPRFYETKFINKFGEVKEVFATVAMIPGTKQSVASLLDISYQKEMERQSKIHQEQLIEAERKMSIGTLTTGIAHEINQPLNALKVKIDSMIFLIENGKILKKDNILSKLKKSSEQVDKITDIIKHMRSLLNQKSSDLISNIDINDAVISSISSLKSQLNQNSINILMDLDKNSPKVYANFIQLEQVIINLLSNAKQALTKIENFNKLISIKTYEHENYVILEVIDNGPGINKDLDKIFEPFYTTNKTGMGLGLSIVQKFVKSWDGEILYINCEDGGAKFSIKLIKVNDIKEDIYGNITN